MTLRRCRPQGLAASSLLTTRRLPQSQASCLPVRAHGEDPAWGRSQEQAHERPDRSWRESPWASRFPVTAGGPGPSPCGYGRDVAPLGHTLPHLPPPPIFGSVQQFASNKDERCGFRSNVGVERPAGGGRVCVTHASAEGTGRPAASPALGTGGPWALPPGDPMSSLLGRARRPAGPLPGPGRRRGLLPSVPRARPGPHCPRFQLGSGPKRTRRRPAPSSRRPRSVCREEPVRACKVSHGPPGTREL